MARSRRLISSLSLDSLYAPIAAASTANARGAIAKLYDYSQHPDCRLAAPVALDRGFSCVLGGILRGWWDGVLWTCFVGRWGTHRSLDARVKGQVDTSNPSSGVGAILLWRRCTNAIIFVCSVQSAQRLNHHYLLCQGKQ